VSQSLAPIGLVHAIFKQKNIGLVHPIAKKKERKKKLFKEDVVYEFN
jgi:hypothetical protein